MDTLTKQDLGVFALDFLDNLTDVDACDGVEREYYAAAFIVTDLDEDGDIRVAMRTSLSNGMVNLRVLQAAQLLETKTMIDAAVSGEDLV